MEGLGAPLLALTLLGLLTATIVVAVSMVRGRARLARVIVLASAAWVGAYAIALIGTSLASRERTLSAGETKRFCGFYLDCHMGVAVERVDTMPSVGDGAEEIRAGGTFYVVTLRVSSDARRVPLQLEQPRAVVVDAEGFRHERSLDAEQRLGRSQLGELEQPVQPGDSFTRAIVIDVPHGVREPRLHVTMGGALERTIELAGIDDEDALLHARTLHALSPGPGVSSASAAVR